MVNGECGMANGGTHPFGSGLNVVGCNVQLSTLNFQLRTRREATRASRLRSRLGEVSVPGLVVGGLDVLGEAFGVHEWGMFEAIAQVLAEGCEAGEIVGEGEGGGGECFVGFGGEVE